MFTVSAIWRAERASARAWKLGANACVPITTTRSRRIDNMAKRERYASIFLVEQGILFTFELLPVWSVRVLAI